MPARTFGYAEVEERLEGIRRRLNRLAIQHAVYICASAALLMATALALLELFAGPTLYRVAYWSMLCGILAATALTARSVIDRLASKESAARFADERAQLKDRLATLHAHGSAHPPSRLIDVLLTDALNCAPSWRVSALGVRRVPRTAYLLGFSAALLLATTFLDARSEPKPTPAPHAEHHQSAVAEENPPSSAHPNTIQSSFSGAAGGSGGSPGRRKGATGKSSGQAAERGDQSPEGMLGEMADADDAQLPEHAVEKPLERTLDGTARSSDRANADKRSVNDDSPAAGEKDRRQSDGAATTMDRSKPPPEGGQRNDANKANEPGTNPQPGAAQGSKSARGGKGGKAGDLFGSDQGGGEEHAAAAHTFALKLTRSSAARVQMDPQGKGEPVSGTGGATAGDTSAPRASEQETPDGALHRADVAPEHEAILSRIFRRD